MKSHEVLDLVRRHGLDQSLAYKIKNPKNADEAIVRFVGGRWMDLLHPSKELSEETILINLSFAVIIGKSLTVFDCCCFDCYTAARRLWAQSYLDRTGLRISHGFWPECEAKMLAHAMGK